MARLRSGFSTARDLLSFLLGAGILAVPIMRGLPLDPIAAGIGATLVGLPAALLARPEPTTRRENDRPASPAT